MTARSRARPNAARRRPLLVPLLMASVFAAAQGTDAPSVDSATTTGAHHESGAAVRDGAAGGTQTATVMAAGSTADTGPVAARSPDYSDGIGYGAMPGMDMSDEASFGTLLLDHLETTHADGANGQAWAVEGGYGGDDDKLWLRSEGERRRGRVDDADLEMFWSHSVAAFWNTQLGVRQDIGDGPDRSWAAFGVQGLAPYRFELEATAYLGASGRIAARVRAEYEMRFTQRLILQPEAEINFHGEDDPARRIGSGLSDVQFGLRLRYEVRRQFAPYLGIEWIRRIGTSADFAGADGMPAHERQIVAGVRIWL